MAARTIPEDIATLPVSDDTKTEALRLNDIIKPFIGPLRRSMHLKYLFFLVYNAYAELGVVKLPDEVAKIVEMPSSSIRSALVLFTYPRTTYRPPDVYIEPHHLLPGYGAQVGLSEEVIPPIVKLCKSITTKSLNGNTSLHQEVRKLNVHNLAGGVLLYYIHLHGLNITLKRLSEVTSLNEGALSAASKLSGSLDN